MMESIDWQKEFPITSICREDLKELGFTDEQIAQLTDEDMETIASKMADLYLDNGFWEDLQFVTDIRLIEKQERSIQPMPPTTKLNLFYMDALDSFKRRVERVKEVRSGLEFEKEASIPSDVLYELIREVADESTPETDQGHGVAALLQLALENPGFVTSEIPHISFTEWEKMGNECTPIALIREQVYQWLVTELETYCKQHHL
jgi:hypothetical protein